MVVTNTVNRRNLIIFDRVNKELHNKFGSKQFGREHSNDSWLRQLCNKNYTREYLLAVKRTNKKY